MPGDLAESFNRDGFLRLPGVIGADELATLQRATSRLIEGAEPGQRDIWFEPGHDSGRPVLRRVDYILDKVAECRPLLGHPRLLDMVERLQGPDFIPTWDSMVVKMPGEGIEVAWHRDADRSCVGDRPIFNVDVYLDDADDSTSLWAVPGSHRWSDPDAEAEVARRTAEGFSAGGAQQIPMRAGDVLLHDILLVHGSPPTSGNALRRVVYLEFRPVATELALGPHTPEYIPLKRAVMREALAERRHTHPDEDVYHYRPGGGTDGADGAVRWRVPHHRYWRAAS